MTVADAFPIGRMGGGGDERQCGARGDEYERGGFCGSKDHIYIYIIISTYELDDMYLPPVFRTRAGGSETFGLVRVVFEKVFAQDDSVVVLVGEHHEYYIYIYVFTYIVYRQQPTSMCSPHSYHMVLL